MPEPTPVPPPVVWFKSQRFLALCQSVGLIALMWLMNGLTTNVWDWRAGLAIPALANIILAWRNMSDPNVVGLLDYQNVKNVK